MYGDTCSLHCHFTTGTKRRRLGFTYLHHLVGCSAQSQLSLNANRLHHAGLSFWMRASPSLSGIGPCLASGTRAPQRLWTHWGRASQAAARC